mmetsp:Transcript_70674/g.185282  ORF Transcript_70674/g.185282 Transcript_70674/m.185282 type:complete len:244 (-) Transcript_70674:684-1415(-)
MGAPPSTETSRPSMRWSRRPLMGSPAPACRWQGHHGRRGRSRRCAWRPGCSRQTARPPREAPLQRPQRPWPPPPPRRRPWSCHRDAWGRPRWAPNRTDAAPEAGTCSLPRPSRGGRFVALVARSSCPQESGCPTCCSCRPIAPPSAPCLPGQLLALQPLLPPFAALRCTAEAASCGRSSLLHLPGSRQAIGPWRPRYWAASTAGVASWSAPLGAWRRGPRASGAEPQCQAGNAHECRNARSRP